MATSRRDFFKKVSGIGAALAMPPSFLAGRAAAQPAGWRTQVEGLAARSFVDPAELGRKATGNRMVVKSDRTYDTGLDLGGSELNLAPGVKVSIAGAHFRDPLLNYYQAVKIMPGAELSMTDFEFYGPFAKAYSGNVIKCETREPSHAGTIRHLARGSFKGASSDILKLVGHPDGCLVEEVHFGGQWASNRKAHCDLVMMPMVLGNVTFRRCLFERVRPRGAPLPPTYNAFLLAATAHQKSNIGRGEILFEECVIRSEVFKSFQLQLVPKTNFKPVLRFRNVFIEPRKFFYANRPVRVVEWTNVFDLNTGRLIPASFAGL